MSQCYAQNEEKKKAPYFLSIGNESKRQNPNLCGRAKIYESEGESNDT
jgi:hypothetical protein